jgi:hypothetical protein
VHKGDGYRHHADCGITPPQLRGKKVGELRRSSQFGDAYPLLFPIARMSCRVDSIQMRRKMSYHTIYQEFKGKTEVKSACLNVDLGIW